MGNHSRKLVTGAREHGDSTALRLDDAEIDYRTFVDAAFAVARPIRDVGVEVGDWVGLIANMLACPLSDGALVGVTAVAPMNPLSTGREIDDAAQDANAQPILAFEEEEVPAAARNATLQLGLPFVAIGAESSSRSLGAVRLSGPVAATTGAATETTDRCRASREPRSSRSSLVRWASGAPGLGSR